MNIRKSLLTAAIALGCLTMTAQTAGEVTEYVFNPHFYGQLQVGGQETLGEGPFGKLFSPNAQIEVGYQFNPIFGVRLGAGFWQSKGTLKFTPSDPSNPAASALISKYGDRGTWKYNYVAPAVDFTFDITNAIWGYNPERLVDVNLFAGVGANVAFKNDEAVAYNNALYSYLGYNGLQNIWDGTKVRFLGRFGIACDFRVSSKVKLGLELNANVLNDNYNSKLARNADWYFNGLVGVKYTFGKSYTKNTVNVEPTIVIQEKIVEKIITRVDTVVVEPAVEKNVDVNPFARNIFFKINSTKITPKEEIKVAEIAEHMKANPHTKVTLTGYADKGTGTVAINLRLAKNRAIAVMNMLVNKYGISASRIVTESMTNQDTEQPFEVNDQNRVVVGVVEPK